MRITKTKIAGALLGLAFVAACRGSSNDTPDAPVNTIDSGPTQIHIQDVQSDRVKEGDPVELHGVIVTAVDKFGAKTGDLWLQDPAGGAFSGVHVFGAPTAQIAGLMPGDVVTLTGAIKTEFVLKDTSGNPTDKSGRTTTELQAPKGSTLTITRTSSGAVPAPYVLDATALDAMPQAARDAEYEKWEGVLITVKNVRTRSYPVGFGSKPFPDDAYKVNATDNLLIESTMSKFTGVDGLVCFASITGVEDYFFDWLLLPRSADDVTVGTGCAAVPVTDSTITALQGTTPTGAIKVTDVYVTGRSFSNTSFWASTSPSAAPNEGVYVFQSSSTLTLDPAIVPGAKVTVTGTVSEFNDDTAGGTLTELTPLRVVVSADAPVTLTPITGKTVADLLVPATAPTYESVLVTLDNVAITAIGTSANGFLGAPSRPARCSASARTSSSSWRATSLATRR